ncbi:MAG: Vps62-related protein [Chloroflexia bacterium]|nr:Vps62-related protein [Chloroflexia bacterium]
MTVLVILGGGPVVAQEEEREPPVPPAAVPAGLTREEELVQRYAPVVYLKQQDHPCDPDGEPYVPAPVEVVFDDEAVVLRQAPAGTEIQRGITATDLYRLGGSFHIDLPGRPRMAGCGYELHFTQQMEDHPPVVYARIVREADIPGLAIQYWFFYYFNDFNDKHEGDWELVQLLFDDSNNVIQAQLYGPTRVVYAQHAGGETANWEDAKIDKEGDRPIVYVAAGSHASFYGPGTWLGWGQDGAGLGCDVTTGPWDRVAPEVRLIPEEITGPADPFAWTTFRGRWGERDTWVYNGPRGPNLSHSWAEPITWQNSLQAGSVRLQRGGTLGPEPAGLFCPIVEAGSVLFTLATPYPYAVGGGLAIAAAIVALLVIIAWPTMAAAWAMYWLHLRIFALIGALLVPVPVLINGFLYYLNRDARLGEWLGVDEDSLVVVLGTSAILTVQQAVLLLIVTPAVIYAVGMLGRGEAPSVGGAFQAARFRLRPVIGVHLLATAIVLVFAITLIGIPLAIVWAVRWTFVVPAVVLERWPGRWALRASAAAVNGNWWRTLVTTVVLLFIGTAFGPVIGLSVLVGANVSQDITNGISSALYAMSYPFAVIGATLLYLQLRARPKPVMPEPVAEPVTTARELVTAKQHA